MRAEASRTTLKDFQPVATTALKIIIAVCLLSTGNVFLYGLSFFWYYKWTQTQTPQGIAQAKADAEARKLAATQQKLAPQQRKG